MSPADDFSPDEWLALLPAPVSPPFPPPGPLRVPADPAADARSARPLTRAALRAAIRPLSAHLTGWLDAQYALAPLNARLLLRFTSFCVLGLALAPAPAVLNDGRFSVRGMGWGLAAYGLFFAFNQLAMVRGSWRGAGVGKRGQAADPDLGSHALAPVARWSQLVRAADGVARGNGDVEHGRDAAGAAQAVCSALVTHREGDPLCPCPMPSCAGGLADAAAWSRAAEYGIRTALAVASTVVAAYTAFVTFAPRFWTSWWWALLACLYIVAMVWSLVTGPLGRISAVFPVMGLVERLHVRAVSLALGGLLDRLHAQLAGGRHDLGKPGSERADGEKSEVLKADREATDPDSTHEELYVRLHLLLSTVWQKRILNPWTGDVTALAIFATSSILCIALNIIGGLCVPAWTLLFGAFVLVLFFLDLSSTAASNAQIRSVTSLYSSARQSLRRMALLHPSHPALPALDRHDAMLASFLDAGGYEMRFWGFAVGYGTVRTVAATVLTVGFGLWGVARGSGMYVTPETVCY